MAYLVPLKTVMAHVIKNLEERLGGLVDVVTRIETDADEAFMAELDGALHTDEGPAVVLLVMRGSVSEGSPEANRSDVVYFPVTIYACVAREVYGGEEVEFQRQRSIAERLDDLEERVDDVMDIYYGHFKAQDFGVSGISRAEGLGADEAASFLAGAAIVRPLAYRFMLKRSSGGS